jgi:zinc protease
MKTMFADQRLRSVRSGAGALLAWLFAAGVAQAMPAIQHWTTENGARVYFVPAPELPMVDVRVVFAAGSARDAALPGLAGLTNGLLDKGASGLSADAIADRLDGLGAQLGSGSLRDMAWVSLRSLSDAAHFDPAVGLMVEVLGKPDFNQRDIDRERERTLVALRHSEQEPEDIAEYHYYAAIYGQHPYASRPIGTESSLKRITRGDITAFHARYYVAGNATIAIVGDIDRAGAERLARRLSAALPAGPPAAPLPAVAPLTKASEEHIFHPSTQTHVLMGAPGIDRDDPDFFPLYVGNHILGGSGLVSQLYEEVREKRGLSYSVYSAFTPMQKEGPFSLGLQTRNDQMDEALRVLRETLQRFHDQGPTEKELEAARKNITGGFALRIDSNSKIIEYLAVIGFYGLPLDYLETFNDKVTAVTRGQIRDAFQRRVHPEVMATVIVGGNQ